MTRTARTAATILTLALATALAWVPARAQPLTTDAVMTIAMRTTARVPQGTTLRLRDVVRITEAFSQHHRAVLELPLGREPIEPDHAWVTIDRDEVRRVLDNHGVDPATYALRGVATEVLALSENTERSETDHEARAGSIDAHGAGDTLRARIELRVRTIYALEPQNLRLGFNDRDADLLNTRVGGRTVHIEPIGDSRRLPLAVTVYDGDRIDLHTTIRVEVMAQREVLRLSEPVRRAERVRPDAWTREMAWVPAAEAYATTETATNAVATAALNAGEIIQARHVEPPIVVQRGDLVTVHCVSGTVIVKVEARATKDARAGELIEFTTGDRTSRHADGTRFRARVLSPGIAVSRVEDQAGVMTTRRARTTPDGSTP